MKNKKILMTSISAMTLLILSSSSLAFAGLPSVQDFYWSEDTDTGDEIFTADSATKTVSQITSGGFVRIDDVELDPLANKLWWNNWVVPPGVTPTEGIYSSDLDGSGETQVTGAVQSTTSNGFASGLHGIALDPADQKVYFTRGVSYANPGPLGIGGEVSVVDMDGTGYTMLNSPTDNWFPSGIALSGNTLYFGDPGVFSPTLSGAVNNMTTAGLDPQQLLPHIVGHGRSLAIDEGKGLIFYSSFDSLSPSSGGGIYVYDATTGGTAQVLDDPDTGIPDIELDTSNMVIYWTDYARGEIRSASYDASGDLGPITTEIDELENPFGLALGFEQAVGGELLPIDSTALFLAGLTSSAVWMIPTLAGIAGAGVIIRSKLSRN